jgi:type II secretory ATPase GspE/PulE/Tfp pilus assembly ATPase PilB-like protein
MWQAVGCPDCNGLGYKGRVGVFEAIKTDAAIEAVLQGNPSEREIWKAAKQQGIWRMEEDGIRKVLTGITTIEELSRVLDLNAF